MSDLPDLILPAVSGSETEYPHVLGEFPRSYGLNLMETHIADSQAAKVWRFQTREALHIFAAALMRNYLSEGIKATRFHCSYEHCYDNRTPGREPGQISVALGTSRPLEW